MCSRRWETSILFPIMTETTAYRRYNPCIRLRSKSIRLIIIIIIRYYYFIMATVTLSDRRIKRPIRYDLSSISVWQTELSRAWAYLTIYRLIVGSNVLSNRPDDRFRMCARTCYHITLWLLLISTDYQHIFRNSI